MILNQEWEGGCLEESVGEGYHHVLIGPPGEEVQYHPPPPPNVYPRQSQLPYGQAGQSRSYPCLDCRGEQRRAVLTHTCLIGPIDSSFL